MTPSTPDISVVVPVFNEREGLPELYRRLGGVMSSLGVSHELILVNDGSSDGSWDVIRSLALADGRVKGISLSRNFGHQLAITAGLHAASGDAVVVMDADLQDPPEVISELYARFREGYDVVYAQRRVREGETLWKRTTASAFYRLMGKMTALEMPVDTGDFRLVSRRVADHLRSLREHNPFVRGLVTWVGYRQTGVLYDRDARYRGETKFSTAKMMRFAFDGITSFSSRPLRFASLTGAFFAILSLALMLALVIYRLSGGPNLVPGWTSLIVSVLLLGGLNLIAIGLLGEYIGRIYDQVKGRPLYLVQERLNADDAEPVRPGASPGAGPGATARDRAAVR
jgi:dolichol-phosphate mannosyltransferase